MAVAVHRRAARRRLLALAAAVGAAFACAAAFLPHDPARLGELAEAPTPVLVAGVLLAWTLLTPALVSGTLLAIATGLLLDGPVALAVALAGATLGATAAFLVARRLGRAPAAVLAGPRLERLRGRVEARPFLTILLARLAPRLAGGAAELRRRAHARPAAPLLRGHGDRRRAARPALHGARPRGGRRRARAGRHGARD